jgi:hypothetical protein
MLTLKLLKWLLIVFGLLSALVFAGVLTAPAAAQSAANETDQQAIANGEQLNDDLVLVERELNNGRAELTFYAETRQRVTIYDASGFMHGGEPAKREAVIPANRTRTISVDSTAFRESRVVGIIYPGGHIGKVMRDDQPWISNWGRVEVGLAILITAAISLALAFGLRPIFKRLLGDQAGRVA